MLPIGFQNRFEYSVIGCGLHHALHLHKQGGANEAQYPVEALNLNDSQRLTRPGPRLFSPALARIPRETK